MPCRPLREILKKPVTVPEGTSSVFCDRGRDANDVRCIDYAPLDAFVSDSRAKEMTPVGIEDIIPLKSRVCVYARDTDYVLCTRPADYYLIDNLRQLPHSFLNGTEWSNAMASSKKMTFVPPMAEVIGDQCTMLRAWGASGLYDKHFGSLSLNLLAIARLVLRHGQRNPKRDGSTPAELRSRVDFGCAGDGSETVPGGGTLPYLTYGFDIFKHIDDAREKKEGSDSVICGYLRWNAGHER